MPVLVTFLGGAALLVYGMRLIRDGLQRLAGGKLRGLLGSWTDRPAKGLLAGAVVTALMQSSTATSVMLVGFTSAGLMTLSQALAVILGADVGTTLTVQLLAFRILDYGLVFVAVGVALLLWPTRRSLRDLGTPILGFGLLFFSIKLMGDGMSPLQGSSILEDLLTGLTTQPLLGIAAAAVFAFLVHSSAATIAIALSLALEGILNLQAALPIVIGANIGTCGTALLSSIGTGAEAKRVAWSHLLFKGVGAAVLLPLLPQFAWMVEAAGGDLPRQIANAHTLFNVGIALAFLPFTGPVARVVTRLVPTEAQEVTPGQPRYLDTRILDTPSLALGQATREALRVADVVSDMLRGAGQVLVHPDPDMIERVQRMDNQVDNLDREIKRYLARLAQEELTQEQSRRELAIMAFSSNLENIGDILDKELMHLAEKRWRQGLHFSEEGLKELREFHQRIVDNLERVITGFATWDPAVAQQVIDRKPDLSRLERELRQHHIDRLHQGRAESFESSEIHLDWLTHLKRINSHITGIAYPILES